ncbi:replication protein A 70 kDa DNA-binding subunit [Trifolium repens]|nr:replication protein A 70 kDa DNA-binding subunit [Trifolium repens]
MNSKWFLGISLAVTLKTDVRRMKFNLCLCEVVLKVGSFFATINRSRWYAQPSCINSLNFEIKSFLMVA